MSLVIIISHVERRSKRRSREGEGVAAPQYTPNKAFEGCKLNTDNERAHSIMVICLSRETSDSIGILLAFPEFNSACVLV